MDQPTLCCYAQSTIYDHYITYINKILSKYQQFFNILPSCNLYYVKR